MIFKKQSQSIGEKIRGILEELVRIDAAIDQAAREAEFAKADLVGVQTALADAEAGVALQEEGADPEGARKQLQDAREQSERVALRQSALATRRQLRHEELLGLENEILGTERADREARVQAWFIEFDKIAISLRACLRKGEAIASATNWDGLGHVTREAVLADPRIVGSNLLDPQITKYEGGYAYLDSAWRDDPAALKVYQELEPRFAPYKRATDLIAELKRRATEEKKQALLHEAFRR
jgi:hypothetical protein